MEPYQKASESIRKSGESSFSVAKNVGLSALSASSIPAAMGLIPKVAALINNYVPDNISQAGLQKLDGRFGSFIKGAMDAGYGYDDIRNFIGEKVQKTASEGAQKEKRSVIEQYSPDLHQFMVNEIKKGRTPIQAGALAQNDKRFRDVISKITKDHKTPWSQILESIYGSSEVAQQQSAAPQMAQQQNQPQMGSGQQALMSVLQKINQRLG